MPTTTALRAAGDTHPGLQRSVNEDRFHFDPVRGLFIVVDGVGGQAAGEKAAETALTMLRARLERETGAVDDRVREAITIANNEIHRLASLRSEWQGMACVLTVAAVVNGDIVVGHVGDTRLYKVRGPRLEKLTRDHSPVGEREDAGELPERDAMHHPRRNEVYRDVGSEHHEPDDPEFIDVFRAPFEADAALLLCTDGLTDAVPSAGIQEVVQAHAGHPYEVVRALIDAANDAGGKDNVTVIYAENHRFADEEDTRDLRVRRPARIQSDTETTANRPIPVKPRTPWRTASLVVLLLIVSGMALYLQRDRFFLRQQGGAPPAPARVTVSPGESIAAAIAAVTPGSEVIVEPGEYRERLILRSDVRVVSRVPRGAVLRLPGGAAETDAAIVATDIAGALLSGFRIIGDAATPLGVGAVVRHADVALVDLEIAGARTAAVQFEGDGSGSIVAGHLHDNPGVAIVVRSGASPRIAHNVFEKNATSERASGTLLVEAEAHPVIDANVFKGSRPEAVILPAGFDGASLRRDNWFIDVPEHPTPLPRPSGKGRR